MICISCGKIGTCKKAGENVKTCDDFDEPTTWFPDEKTVDTDNDVSFTPFVKAGRVGYKITEIETGDIRYVYLNPSAGGDPPANVFIYIGEHNNPNDDESVYWIEA